MNTIDLQTEGHTDIIDITDQVEEIVSNHAVKEGIVLIFVASSTTAITTIEYESGAIRDLKEALEIIAPMDGEYAHNARWGDGNGYAHVRSALMKNSLVMPVSDAKLVRGSWQQIVVIDFDNRPRERQVLVRVVG